jgi:radical SAM superfamily enzyme YgiQ (UPF0313 family)
MKVLIINSPLFRHTSPLYDEDSLPSLGLGYIASMLEIKGFEVKLVDAIAESLSLMQTQDVIKANNPKVLAINIFTTNFNLVKEIVENLDTNIKVVIGGLSTRTLYEQIFTWDFDGNIDVIFGDGELVLPDILNGKEIQQPEIQTINRRFFKIDSHSPYFCENISNLPLNRNFFSNEPTIHPLGFIEANIIASRGCIYNCSFCAAARSLNRDIKIRERTPESLVCEINDILKRNKNVNSIRVLDDLFLKNNHSIKLAIDVFKNFNLSWRSMAHIMTFKNTEMDELLKLKNTGCSELFIGIESGSPKILKSIHKTHNIKLIKENLSRVLQAGIALKGYFIYGFPNENKYDFELTYQLACEIKEIANKYGSNFRTSVFQFRPYHGTELFHVIKKQGINEDRIMQMKGNKELSKLLGRLQFNFHTGNYSKEDINTLQSYIYRTANLTSYSKWNFNI